MADYKPSLPYNVAIYLLKPETKNVKGVTVKSYPKTGDVIYCSFKTYGGTESNNNGVYTVIDTAIIETWYRPDITSNCRICLIDQPNKIYKIIGTPENINMRNQFIKFKVEAVNGGV